MSLAVINTKDYFTCAEAADELGLTADSVRTYCNNLKEGKSPSLEATKVGRDWLIHKSEIARYKKDRTGRGRPRQI